MGKALSSIEYSTMVWKKFPYLQCSNNWEMHFVKLLPLWYDLIVSPPKENNSPINLHCKICPPMKNIFWKKVLPLHTLRGMRHHERVSQNKSEIKRNYLKERNFHADLFSQVIFFKHFTWI